MKPHYCSKGHENPSGSRFCVQCGEQLSNEFQGISPGMMLGDRYRIVRELGHGGFGRTYLAEDLNRFNENCVLKEFAPQVQGTYALQKASELFEREAGVLYKLQHPQIPKFRELFRFKQADKGLLFLVQDYVVGQTYYALLDARRRQGLRFNEAEVTQLLLQILPVLEYIHSLGVVHRDISPDNLMLRSTDGLPVLIDFGGVKQVAATVASQLASQGVGGVPAIATRLGKVGYAPHEQMQTGIVSPHSDLYALAATVLVLLTLKEPPQLIDPQTLAWDWRREVALSSRLANVLERMLQPRPGDRFQTATQVLQALNAPSPPPPVAYSPTQPPPTARTAATVAVAPAAASWNQPASTPTAGIPTPEASPPSSGWLGKISIVFVAIAFAGGVGWLAGNLWIQSQTQPDESQPQPTADTPLASPEAEPEPTSELSPAEQRRKEVLQQRRTALGIRYDFYAALVNEAFWTQYPDQRGRTLGTGEEDAQSREQWDAIAADWLGQLEQYKLSPGTRLQLGGYTDADRERWKVEANQLHIGSRTLYDIADAKFFLAFPDQKEKDFLSKPIGQVWQATVADTLEAVKSGAAFERITFDPGAVDKQVGGSLQPGEGKAFIASLAADQLMDVNLTAGEKVLFSIYSPSGKTAFLEDSSDRTWSGQLPESGFYEFVVVNEGTSAIDYQLNLTVENPAPPEPSPEVSPE